MNDESLRRILESVDRRLSPASVKARPFTVADSVKALDNQRRRHARMRAAASSIGLIVFAIVKLSDPPVDRAGEEMQSSSGQIITKPHAIRTDAIERDDRISPVAGLREIEAEVALLESAARADADAQDEAFAERLLRHARVMKESGAGAGSVRPTLELVLKTCPDTAAAGAARREFPAESAEISP